MFTYIILQCRVYFLYISHLLLNSIIGFYIFTSFVFYIFTSLHLYIFTSFLILKCRVYFLYISHLLYSTFSHLLYFTFSHLWYSTFLDLYIFTFSHLLYFWTFVFFIFPSLYIIPGGGGGWALNRDIDIWIILTMLHIASFIKPYRIPCICKMDFG